MKETFKKMTIYDDYEYEVRVHSPHTSLFFVPSSTSFSLTIPRVRFLVRVPIAWLLALLSPLALSPLHPPSLLAPRFS
jgi:hypothetical protein